MKVLYWNARSIGNLDTRLFLKNCVLCINLIFLFIYEPWIAYEKLPIDFCKDLGLNCFAVNDRATLLPNLWCFCQSNLMPYVIGNTSQ